MQLPIFAKSPLQLTETSRCKFLVSVNACSIKGDVKENTFPSTGGRGDFLGIQPLSTTRGAWFGCPARRSWCLVLLPVHSLIFSVATTPRRFLKPGKRGGCTVSTMVLSEARGLVLFRVVRGGIGFTQRLGAHGTVAYRRWHTRPRTRASQEPTGHHRRRSAATEGLFTGDAQAACDFSFSASKPSPFFHSVSVMAAILRASVSRAMVGFMPFASNAW